MNPERARLAHCIRKLSREERTFLAVQASRVTKTERYWTARYDERINSFDEWVFRELHETGKIDVSRIDFRDIVAEQAYGVASMGEREARSVERGLRMASAPPPIKIPRSFRDLRILYDRWKRTGKLPPHQKAIADRLKKYYLQRCRSIWRRYASDFVDGKEFKQDRVKAVLQKQGDMAKARAETIANTETTNYYNASRRSIYDASRDVTHYLFVAIRDRATTKWCRSRQGLVFTKGTKLCEKNTPACHWNCRSEMLPLTAQNPRHRALIEDEKLRAENNRLYPLPPGWRSAT